MKASLGVLALLCFTATAAAQQPVSPEAFARAQSLLQQVGREKTALEAENTQLLAERARLVRQVEALTQGLSRAETDDVRAAQHARKLESRLADTARAQATLQQQLTETRRALAALERERAARAASAEKLTQALTAQTRRTNEVTEKNRALAGLVTELMDQLARRRGVLTAWLAREPVTGLGEVDVENVLQSARTRLFELGVRTATDPGLEQPPFQSLRMSR